MAIYVNELGGSLPALRSNLVRGQSPVASYSLSSASTAPFPSAGVSAILVSADAASLLNLISTSTGLALTSTNAYRIPANAAPALFQVSTLARITVQST